MEGLSNPRHIKSMFLAVTAYENSEGFPLPNFRTAPTKLLPDTYIIYGYLSISIMALLIHPKIHEKTTAFRILMYK